MSHLTGRSCVTISHLRYTVSLLLPAHRPVALHHTGPTLQVGMLGANAPARVKTVWNIDVAGKLIKPATPRWGHMISAHYLKHMKKGEYAESKLHMYMKEEAPERVTKERVAPLTT